MYLDYFERKVWRGEMRAEEKGFRKN